MNSPEQKNYRFSRWFVAGVLPAFPWMSRIDKNSEKKIEEIKDLIHNKRQDLSVILYFNHISIIDPLFAGNIVRRIDKKGTRKLIAPMSFSNTEIRKKNRGNLIMKDVVEKCGIETHRIIQSYQIDNPDYDYTKVQAYRQNKPFFQRLKELGSQKIPTMMIISPEGHRTDGSMIKGEEGMVTAGDLLSPTLYVPIGILYEGEIKKNGLNIGKRVNLNIGETFLLEPRANSKGVFGEILMPNLANTLPIKMRGFYRKDVTNVPKSSE